MNCFEYYYKQEGMWFTKFIEDEWNPVDKSNVQGKNTSSDSSNVKEGEEKNEPNQSLVATTNDSNDEEGRKIQATQSIRRTKSGSQTDESGQGGKKGKSLQKKLILLLFALENQFKQCNYC